MADKLKRTRRPNLRWTPIAPDGQAEIEEGHRLTRGDGVELGQVIRYSQIDLWRWYAVPNSYYFSKFEREGCEDTAEQAQKKVLTLVKKRGL